jgi:hypothetical protein
MNAVPARRVPDIFRAAGVAAVRARGGASTASHTFAFLLSFFLHCECEFRFFGPKAYVSRNPTQYIPVASHGRKPMNAAALIGYSEGFLA